MSAIDENSTFRIIAYQTLAIKKVLGNIKMRSFLECEKFKHLGAHVGTRITNKYIRIEI